MSTKKHDHWLARLEDYERKTKEHPDDGELWLEYASFLGRECEASFDTVTAYRNAQRLLQDGDFRPQIGYSLFELGRTQEGIQVMRESVDANPTSYGCCMLADALLKCGHVSMAIDYLDIAISIEPEFEESYFLKGEAVKKSSRSEASSFYRKAIELDPDYQMAWKELGSVLIGDDATVSEGILALTRAISLDPDDSWAMVYLAMGFWRVNNLVDAERCYQKACDLSPENAQFLRWQAEFLDATKSRDSDS